MKYFLTKLFRFSLIGLIPLAIIIIIYLILDPFKVIYSYDSYFEDNVKGEVVLDKDFVSTSTYINNVEKQNYNSFILGNSRSIFYQISDWKIYLNQEDNCFHFDASGESLWGINKKVEFIDKKGIRIKNILLILDYETLIQEKPKTDHLRIISPALVNNSNLVKFHKTFLKAFLTPKFLYAYIDFKLNNEIKPYMTNNYLLDDRPKTYDVLINEVRFDYFEKLADKNKYYSSNRLAVFYKRDTLKEYFSTECILKKQKEILLNIMAIARKHNTNVKVVINPLYDQLKLNKSDLEYIENLFGKKNVFDFSGINHLTNNYKNYYENSHYRPHVAREIMKFVYHK